MAKDSAALETDEETEADLERPEEQVPSDDELRRANAELKLAMIKARIASFSRPWWQSWSVASVGALLAASAPATAAVIGHFDHDRELRIEQQKQAHEFAIEQKKEEEDVRRQYLDRVSDPRQARRTLRFIIATDSDSSVREWARSEFGPLEKDAERVDAEEAKEEDAIKKLESQLQAAIASSSGSANIKPIADVIQTRIQTAATLRDEHMTMTKPRGRR